MYLVIGPGAMHIFAFLGVVAAIGTENIDEVSGSSAGSILGFLICLGKTIDEIKEFLFSIDLVHYSKVNIASLIFKFGLIPHGPIKKLFVDFCGGKNPTFKDLPKKLHVAAYCVNKMETEYFSVDNTPDMSVIDAMCMSISVPFMFESTTYNTFTYIDGGTRESIPYMAFLHRDPKDVIIIKHETQRTHVPEIKNIKDFIFGLVKVALTSFIEYHNAHASKIVSLDLCDVDQFDFSMEYETKLKLYLFGYASATCNHSGLAK